MSIGVKIHALRLAALAALFGSLLSAQFGTELVTDKDIGRPPQPPFITFLGIVTPGKTATDPSLIPQGPVAEVLFDEVRAIATPGGPAGEIVTSIKTKYDEQGRLIEEIRNPVGADTLSRYDGSHLVSQESTFPNSKTPKPKSWNYWTYDQSGKLTEYRRGSGGLIQNHWTNFKRDSLGRLLDFDYLQGPNDGLFSHTHLEYSADGKTAKISSSDQAGNVTRITTQTVDDFGRVVQASIQEWDWKAKKLKLPLKVAFRYDQQGRLIEQNTAPHDFERGGSEHELPPGKISIAYDDVQHTKTTAYSGPEGTISATLTYNSGGAVIGVSMSAAGQTFDTMQNCSHDSHGNWTHCEQFVEKAAVKAVTKECAESSRIAR